MSKTDEKPARARKTKSVNEFAFSAMRIAEDWGDEDKRKLIQLLSIAWGLA